MHTLTGHMHPFNIGKEWKNDQIQLFVDLSLLFQVKLLTL